MPSSEIDARKGKEAFLRTSKNIFLVSWTLALIFWIFADVRMAFQDGDPNSPLLEGMSFLTIVTVEIVIVFICVLTLVVYLYAWRASKK